MPPHQRRALERAADGWASVQLQRIEVLTARPVVRVFYSRTYDGRARRLGVRFDNVREEMRKRRRSVAGLASRATHVIAPVAPDVHGGALLPNLKWYGFATVRTRFCGLATVLRASLQRLAVS